MQAGLEEFQRRGVQLVAVGQGTEEEAAHYCGRYSSGFPCLGDPDRSSYRALGLVRSEWWSMVVVPLIVLLYDQVTGTGSNTEFQIVGFMRLTIISVDLKSAGRDAQIVAVVDEITPLHGDVVGWGASSPNLTKVQIVD